jgi:EmrB/QacA subfamily drug resistance transporter
MARHGLQQLRGDRFAGPLLFSPERAGGATRTHLMRELLQQPADDPNERAALIVAALASFLTPFMGASANVALPAIAREFAIDTLQLSWVATAFLLAATICLVPAGRLADLHGRKLVFTWGLVTYTLGSLLSAVVFSAGWLIGARFVQGIGGALMFGTNIAILTSVFPPERRGAALGINVSAVYLGLSLGPVLGGLLTEQAGWRSVFAANACLGGLTTLLALRKLRGEWLDPRAGPMDWAGSVVYAAALAMMMYGLSILPGRRGAACTLAGLLALVVFVWWETRTPSPVLDVRLFLRSRVFALSNAAALVNYSATFAVGFLLSLYLQYVRQASAQRAGLILLWQPVVQTIVSPFAGRLSDRIESRVVASAGMAVTVVGLALLALITTETPTRDIVVCLVVLGVGFGLFSSPNSNAVMSAVEPHQYGVAAATLATMRLFGQMLSMGIAMVLLSSLVGRVSITQEHHASLVAAARSAFGAFAVLCLGGTLASLARGRMRE